MESGILIDLLVRHLAMEKKTRMIATMICLYSDYKVVNILYFSSTIPPLYIHGSQKPPLYCPAIQYGNFVISKLGRLLLFLVAQPLQQLSALEWFSTGFNSEGLYNRVNPICTTTTIHLVQVGKKWMIFLLLSYVRNMNKRTAPLIRSGTQLVDLLRFL